MSVTVVIPSYNRAHLLPTAIESVLAQSYQDTEIVVVDDGSTDDTRSAVARFGERLRYVHQTNAGVGAARNTGIRHATGEYIAFLDSDDRWYDFKLSLQTAILDERPDVGLVFSEFVIEKPGGELQRNGCERWIGRPVEFPTLQSAYIARPPQAHAQGWPSDRIEYRAGTMYRQLLDELPILTSSTIVRRAALEPSMRYGEGIRLFEDWEFFARVARKHAVAFVPLPTAINVGHPDPTRVSWCDALTRARCYLSLLDRVWGDDPDFVAAHGEALREARGRACLAVSRQAVLASEPAEARAALRRWGTLGLAERRHWAAIYGLCARVPGGRNVLRTVLRGHATARLLAGERHGRYHPVHPAA